MTGADPNNPGVTILPGGARVRPAGQHWIFNDPELPGGMTSGLTAIAGTSFVLTVDTSALDHGVRLVDTALIGTAENPVVSKVVFPIPEALNWGITFVAPNRAFVATNNGVVQALTVDPAAKTIVKDETRSVALPPGTGPTGGAAPWFASGVAASPDGKRLVVSAVREKRLLVFDIDPQSADYGKTLADVDLGKRETFGVYFDPNDASGRYVYVSMWNDRAVFEVDLDAAGGAAKTRSFTTGKAPGGITFLDGRWMAVATGLGDGIALVDRVSGMTHEVLADPASLPGMEPTTLEYDPAAQRLYVALSGVSAVMVYSVDLSSDPPTLAPVGRIPTLWWPSGVAVQSDGSVIITSLHGEGIGPGDDAEATGKIKFAMETSGIQRVGDLTEAAVAKLDAQFQQDADIGALPGHSVIECPAGTNDFPIPATNGEGPSKVIDHVFVIIRENKTFDALLGDLPNVAGDPALTLIPDASVRKRVWQNLRALTERFALSDNFYTAAEVSIVGHTWATLGRTTDFVERAWPQSGFTRKTSRVATENGGVYEIGFPEEGGLFDALAVAGITHDILGENQGLPKETVNGRIALDFKYPGGFVASVEYPDNEKACYFAGRLRVLCNLGQVTYLTLANDHAVGIKTDKPLPEVMIAVNDEATGMVIDAISHSPYWDRSLVFLYEDDTAQGGDHISAHRTVMLAASPWIKRGYVGKTNIDVSSIHKIISHVYGLPYPNVQVARAGLPLDMFTSTPDFAPFDYLPRAEPLVCKESTGTKPEAPEEAWDVSAVDKNPGLDLEVTRWLGRDRSRP